MTAEERRESVLAAAVREFAALGLHGASTEAIAERAGISQPYVFRLFGTKKELFIAAVERVCDHILARFREAAASVPPGRGPERSGQVLEAMGRSYEELLDRRDELLLLLQGFAACKDPDVLEVSRRRMREVYELVAHESGAHERQVQWFMATGMLLTVSAGMDLPGIAHEEPWARKMITVRA